MFNHTQAAMNRVYRLPRRLSACAGISLCAVTVASAEGSGGETALIATSILTAAFVVIIFFVIFVLNGNLDPIVRAVRGLYRSVIPRPSDEEAELGHDFDGIHELNNRIPPWFNYLFGVTIIFGIIYFINYHVVGSSPLPEAEYRQELAAADLMKRLQAAGEGEVNEATLEALTDDASLAAGAERFKKYCVTCHGFQGEGKIGPNLTDAYWIHGGRVKDIFTTIKQGVPAKGMISWKLVFTPKEMQQLSSYILSLNGTNPPNAKKPEGLPYAGPPATGRDSTASGARL